MTLWCVKSLVALALLVAVPAQDSYHEAKLALLGRDYESAIRLLEKSLAEAGADAQPQVVDRLRFLTANARYLAGERREAEAGFKRLIEQRPDSAYLHLARFAIAQCREDAREFQDAARIYREEIARLLSAERRMALAQVYLDQAQKALSGEPTDRKAAIAFLDLALELQLPQQESLALQEKAAKLAFEAQDWQAAANRFQNLVVAIRGEVFGEGNGKPAHEARLWLARAWRPAGNTGMASRLLEDLLREGLGTELAARARFELALCYGVPGQNPELSRGVDALESFLAQHPNHEKAPEAAYLLAQSQAQLGRITAALQTLEKLLRDFADSGAEQLAEAMADRAVLLTRLEQFEAAADAWRAYLSRYPAHGRWMQAQRAIVDLAYMKAERLRNEGKNEYDEAIRLYLRFLEENPLDGRAPAIHLLIAKMREEQERYEDAKLAYERCAEKYPNTPQASEAQYRIGRLLETELFHYERAIEAYEKVKGPFAGAARQRIQVLREESLALSTERVWQTDEKPRIKVATRNLETLRVRVYKLDLESFHRGTMGGGAIAGLAIEVIEPDATFESKTPNYTKHQELEREIVLPFEKQGAYVVKVDGGELEATTLVLVSDIAIVTKHSREELFVYAQNTRTNQVAPRTEIVVTDGNKLVAEGVTDATGVWRLRGEELHERNQLHVLATSAEGGIATTLNLSGLTRSTGMQPRYHVYSDRLVYQPGETVNTRAVLRDVDAGVYVVPVRHGYRLMLHDNSGRLLSAEPLQLSAFGTLHASFALPADAPSGTYSVRLWDEEKRQVIGNHSLQVREYSPPRVSLAIESERTVVVRGEKIEGVVRAKYFFGGPVVGKNVEVTTDIRGPRVVRGQTDKAGEFRFEFESLELWQGAQVLVRAQLPEEQAQAAQLYRVERTGFELALSLPSEVYLVGEDLEAKVVAKGHDGKPLARKLVLELNRLETQNGRVTEIPVAQQELTTSGETGVAFGRFELQRGGKHRLRVHGEDRFQQRIDATHEFFVSGKDDEVRLRILSDVQHGKVGDRVSLRVVNRAGPRLCLVTHEGDSVLEYETRIVPEGESRMELEFSELHAPNFAFALAIVDLKDKKLHTAAKEFKVAQPLTVRVVPGSQKLLPGGKVEVELEAKDSRGRPVEGEFSLAFVDQAEIDLWGEDGTDLYQVFFGDSVQRATNMRVASSCTFSYSATTQKVNQAIREAERRAERQMQEEKAKAEWSGGSDDFEMGRGLRRARSAPAPSGRPMADKKQVDEDSAMEAELFNDAIGLGGGAGGGLRGRSVNNVQQMANPPQLRIGILQAGQPGQWSQDAAKPGQVANFFGKQLEVLGESGGHLAMQDTEHVRSALAASAVWLPSVETDANGRARVTVEMPRRTASWRLRVRGVGRSSLFGEAKAELLTAKELLVETALPDVLTEGDRAQTRIDLHNLGGEQRNVKWRLHRGDEQLAQGSADVPAEGHVERGAELEAKDVGTSAIVVAAESGEAKDAFVQDFEVLPWGIEERVVQSGRLSARIDVPMALPAGREYRSRELVVELGPDAPADLFPFGGLRTPAQLCLNRPHYLPPTIDNRAAMGLGALVLLQSYGETAPGQQGEISRLRAQVESTIAALSASEQNGQFVWMGGLRGRKVFQDDSSLVAAYFLLRARQAGFTIDSGVHARVRTWLAGIQRGREAAEATFAFLALAIDGEGDFTRFNTLYRNRTNYGLGELGRLALAAHAMGRPGLAIDLEQRLTTKLDLPQRVQNAEDVAPSAVTERLWALLALAKGKGHEPVLRQGEQWLQQTRRPWGYTQALPLALGAEFLAQRRTADANLPARVTLRAGKFEKVLDFEADPTRRRVVIPAGELGTGSVTLTLEPSGRGELVWSAMLSGLTRGLPARDPKEGTRIARDYLQDARMLGGKPLPQGFACISGRLEPWKNHASTVALGESIDVELRWWHPSDTRERHGTVVLEEPLPAGCVVRLEDVQGNFDHVELGAGFLRFYLSARHRSTVIRYPLRGFLPGKYRVLPAHAYSIDGASLNEYGDPAELRVLERGAESPDVRRPTPDELLAQGTRLFDELTAAELENGGPRRDAAWETLHGLYAQYGRLLREQAFQQIARRLLSLALARDDAANIIVFFEALKDRDEDYVLSFENTAKVAEAYYRSGEFEQSLRTLKAIAETAFLKEMQIAGTLDRLGELLSSIRFVETLSMNYPGLPVVRGTLYSLANSLTLKAKELAASGKAYDPKVGTPLDLRKKARQLCYEYLVRYPDDADADEVLFTVASIALEAEQLDEAIELLQRGVTAHPESDWLDDFLYLEGYAWFEKRERQKALELLERVATEQFRNAQGRLVPSDSRELALFLQGQIHHAAGDPAKALELYAKVDKRFIEAREASDYFQSKELRLPEVNLVQPGEPSKLELVARNLEKATVTVYQVDLMRLYLLRKSLSDMGDVQLFGIAPIHTEELDLGRLAKYREHEVPLTLPMKDAGAYLVLVRAGELLASGLLLRTDLEVEAQELTGEARLRVNVKRDGVFLPQAQVKVVGEVDGRIRSGETDLRGVYVADDLRGQATVLVKDGESYAFYRSKSQFGGSPAQQQGPDRRNQQMQELLDGGRFDALEQNLQRNFDNQMRARDQLKKLYENQQEGVEIKRSK